MRHPIIMPCLVVVGLGLSNFAVAQRAERPSVALVVEDTDAEAVACGIEKSAIESIAVVALRNNGVHVDNNTLRPMFNVTVVVLQPRPRGCIAYVSVALESLMPRPFAVGGFRTRTTYSIVEMCRSGVLLTGGQGTMSSFTHNAVEQQIKLCLGKLDY